LEGLSKALAANDQWPDEILVPDPLDTPEELAAKAAFDESLEACADVMKGQRSFCVVEALNKFQERMGAYR